MNGGLGQKVNRRKQLGKNDKEAKALDEEIRVLKEGLRAYKEKRLEGVGRWLLMSTRNIL